MRKVAIFIVAALLLSFYAMPVYANGGPPGFPDIFYGDVTINDSPAPDGTQISATVAEGEVLTTSQNPVATENGNYGIDGLPLLVQGYGLSGAITFYVNGVEVEGATATFEAGGGPTQVDLSVTIVAPSVGTSAATSVTTSRATLNGNLANLGTALSVAVSFEWGKTTAYGKTATVTASPLSEAGTFSATLSGLSSSTTYHFRAKAVGEGTSYGDDKTFTTKTPSGPGPTYYYIDTNLFGTEASFRISSTGEILETIEATSDDGMLTITLPEGTICLNKDGNPLDTLEVAVDETPPDPPEDAHIIGLAYDFTPDGATFDPPLTLTWSYDPDLPEDVAEEDLVVAYYDEATGEWVELDCVVDTENNTITASVPHFTTFAIIGAVTPPAPPAPAAFSVSSLSVLPAEVEPGEAVTIAVSVANTGGESGSYTVVLKIDGVKEDEERVTVAAGSSKTVTFSVTREEAGNYTVAVNGLSGSFTVTPVVVPPEPAAFSVAYLSFSPLEVEPGEAVTITVLVANIGGESGSYTVVLKIDGVKEAEETVTIAAGESQDVSFSVSREEAGDYTVNVDGLSGSFTVTPVVVPPEPGINWALIGGIIGGVIVVVGLLIYFLVVRRRA